LRSSCFPSFVFGNVAALCNSAVIVTYLL
jgi:hypothetical protein